jgi:hypothetical protein
MEPELGLGQFVFELGLVLFAIPEDSCPRFLILNGEEGFELADAGIVVRDVED